MPQPQLDAVNIILSAIGETPVNSLSSGSIDAVTANSILQEVSKEVQTEGWWFNTIKNERITPTNNQYTLPTNTLSVDTTGSTAHVHVILRGNRLYSPVGYQGGSALGFDIGTAYPQLFIDRIEELPFNSTTELPHAAQVYITKRAARVFVDRMLGEATLIRSAMMDEANALTLMKRMESNNSDHNIFNTMDAFKTLDRGINYSRNIRFGGY